ncbi:alpha/beta hydrolase [Brevundimonas poindexterae]|uniref:alpha/beta hydrolase n=1 Tax=Brevundimonas poindexterae TaxID=74325 RepID=UPI001CFE1D0D|nr:alpha/beta hydrolase [Brevundimonas poindexterae]
MPRLHTVRNLILGALVVAGLLYLAVAGLVYVNQRSLMYFPDAERSAPDAAGPAIQVVEIATDDGERLVGWWLPPQEGQPTLLFFNGNAAGLAGQRGRWRRIADQGLGFLAIGYRGYDGSTGSPSEAGLHEDARAAWDWLAARTDTADIVIHGFSLGSGVATRLATERPARALILEAPYTSTADVAARSYPWLPVRWLMKDQYRSADIIDQVDMPILILHGNVDEVIPYDLGRTLYDRAPAPKQFIRMIGSNHNTLVRDGGYDHIWRFLGLTPVGPSAAPGHQADVEILRERRPAATPSKAP